MSGRSTGRRWQWLGIWPEQGDDGRGPCGSGRGVGLRPGLSGGLGWSGSHGRGSGRAEREG
jgi:hypothetical protein